LAAELSIRLHLEGPQYTYSVACASSAIALGEARRAINAGLIDAAIVGGAEAMLTAVAYLAWKALGVLAPLDAEAEQSCRPFSGDRNGLVLGEGAAFLILEGLNHVDRQAT